MLSGQTVVIVKRNRDTAPSGKLSFFMLLEQLTAEDKVAVMIELSTLTRDWRTFRPEVTWYEN